MDTQSAISHLSAEDVKYSLANSLQVTFEVTDACNLDCTYCAYGPLYQAYGKHGKRRLSEKSALNLLDYLYTFWLSEYNTSYRQTVYISFYGGEPLLNMPLIRTIVDYVEGMDLESRSFTFSMTTNALLLYRYIDFCVDHDIRLLISLDGDEHQSSYRVDKQGRGAFKRVVETVDHIRDTYPDYFRSNVSFNSVLHDRNSVKDITDFFRQRYDKIPSIGELNNSGIRPKMMEIYRRMYRSKLGSVSEQDDTPVREEMLNDDPAYHSATLYLMNNSPYAFKDYNELIYGKEEKRPKFPSGTCIPFSRKVYVTVDGSILPCERISPRYSLGRVTDTSVELVFEDIAAKYNALYDKLGRCCSRCYHRENCSQCMFYIDDIATCSEVHCPAALGKEEEKYYEASQLLFLRDHPEAYERIMSTTIIQ